MEQYMMSSNDTFGELLYAYLILILVLYVLLRCLTHIINLATQAVISTRSKAKYFNPHDDDAEIFPDVDAERDEVGLICMISVKVCDQVSVLHVR
ncbi:hypothetical protein BDN70DRAFT_880177 [Pholiota conissans]|uniref:Uncharacterized protein n=1 Tax=Pholiota conissans TaxID=109636 RepID=A0A9P6CZ99_9AGAR|nr:hypothetical protein BDN70DRAFT_880177 [Pholiota conissans]